MQNSFIKAKDSGNGQICQASVSTTFHFVKFLDLTVSVHKYKRGRRFQSDLTILYKKR